MGRGFESLHRYHDIEGALIAYATDAFSLPLLPVSRPEEQLHVQIRNRFTDDRANASTRPPPVGGVIFEWRQGVNTYLRFVAKGHLKQEA